MLRRSTGDRPRGRRLATVLAAALGATLLGAAAPPAAQADAGTAPRPIMSGWIPYWSTSAGVDAVLDNSDLFGDVSPFWYSAQWSNSASRIAQQVSSASKTYLLDSLRPTGVEILPAITDGMGKGRMAAVMKDATLRTAFVNQLVALAVNNGYDGVDLDFEGFAFADGSSTWSTTRPAWVAFVKQLSAALHAKGKQLAVTTPPLYDTDYDGSSGYWVYDWKAIAPYVDRLRIMAYDYSVSGGNIAPFWWVEKVLAFAVTQVPASKIQLGVAAYGRNAVKSISGTCPTNVPSNYRSVLSFTAAAALTAIPSAATTSSTVDRTAAVRTWVDTDSLGRAIDETKFTYTVTYKGTTSAGAATKCTVSRYGWYSAASSAVERAKLVGKYQIAGIAQWTVGGEMDSQWSRLRDYAVSIAPVPTDVVVDAPASQVFGTAATVRATASAEGAAVAGARAVLYARPTGTTSWSAVSSATTAADGTATFSPTVTSGTEYKVAVAGAWDRVGGSGTDVTKVKTVIATKLSASAVKSGTTVTLGVALSPKVAGQEVRRQIWRTGTGWVTLDKKLADATGKVSFSFTPTTRKTYTYRVYAVGSATITGTTTSFKVTVS